MKTNFHHVRWIEFSRKFDFIHLKTLWNEEIYRKVFHNWFSSLLKTLIAFNNIYSKLTSSMRIWCIYDMELSKIQYQVSSVISLMYFILKSYGSMKNVVQVVRQECLEYSRRFWTYTILMCVHRKTFLIIISNRSVPTQHFTRSEVTNKRYTEACFIELTNRFV